MLIPRLFTSAKRTNRSCTWCQCLRSWGNFRWPRSGTRELFPSACEERARSLREHLATQFMAGATEADGGTSIPGPYHGQPLRSISHGAARADFMFSARPGSRPWRRNRSSCPRPLRRNRSTSAAAAGQSNLQCSAAAAQSKLVSAAAAAQSKLVSAAAVAQSELRSRVRGRGAISAL